MENAEQKRMMEITVNKLILLIIVLDLQVSELATGKTPLRDLLLRHLDLIVFRVILDMLTPSETLEN